MVNVSESFGGVVGLVTAFAGDTRNPIFEIPDAWFACTVTGIDFPDDARAPGEGASSDTCSACTLMRKRKRVSSEKLPAPSMARPTSRISPPAPEFDGKVIVRFRVTLLLVPVKIVSCTAM